MYIGGLRCRISDEFQNVPCAAVSRERDVPRLARYIPRFTLYSRVFDIVFDFVFDIVHSTKVSKMNSANIGVFRRVNSVNVVRFVDTLSRISSVRLISTAIEKTNRANEYERYLTLSDHVCRT